MSLFELDTHNSSVALDGPVGECPHYVLWLAFNDGPKAGVRYSTFDTKEAAYLALGMALMEMGDPG